MASRDEIDDELQHLEKRTFLRNPRFLGNNPRQKSCPAQINRKRSRKTSRKFSNQCSDGHCNVHCPGGSSHLESFDYYAHPTSRASLFQLRGIENNNNNNNEAANEFLLRKILSSDNENSSQLKSIEVYDEELATENYDSSSESCLKVFGRFWRSILIVLVPLILLPIVFSGEEGKTDQAFKCAYVMLMMAVFWVTEAIPLAITSLIPVALLPILGIMSTNEVSKEYLKETNFMFMSGIIIAIAVEHCKLHKRIALKFMLSIGTGPRKLMLGFMVPTMFLSMWISNTATTAMMVPIVDAVMSELDKELDKRDQEELDSSNVNSSKKDEIRIAVTKPINQEQRKKMRIMMFLSVAYAANTGGTGTLTGTGSNLVLKGVLSEMSENSPVNFANWSLFAAPLMLINLLLCWLWLQYWFMGFSSLAKSFQNWRQKNRNSNQHQQQTRKKLKEDPIMEILRQNYKELGVLSFHEASVAFLFLLLIFLWIFRDPKFIVGWGNYVHIEKDAFVSTDDECLTNCTYNRVIYHKEAIDDATAGVIITILLFILPSQLNFWPFNKQRRNGKVNDFVVEPSEGLLSWSVVHQKMPWSIVFLLGGGFALAKATDVSGLSIWLGSQLEVLNFLDKRLLALAICLFTSFATEVTSNVAACSILLPVLRDLALSLEFNPLYLMIPATLTCSYAFMLPVATPPNAIVFSASGMKTMDMVKCGFFFNIICVLSNFFWMNTMGSLMFQLDGVPYWALEMSQIVSHS